MLLSSGAIGYSDVKMELGMTSTSPEELKAPKIHLNTRQQYLFPEIITWLLEVIHRPCYEQFHVEGCLYYDGEVSNTGVGGALLHVHDSTYKSGFTFWGELSL